MHHIRDVTFSETTWRMLIIVSGAFVLLFSVYCLSRGITIIFMHLFYFPIVLLAYRYRLKGFLPAALLGLGYFLMVVWFVPSDAAVVSGAFYRLLVFIGIAGVVAYLSENLGRSEERFRGLVEDLGDNFLVFSCSPAGTITYMSPGCTALFGQSPNDLVAQSWIDIPCWTPESRLKIESIIRNMAGGTGSTQGTIQYVHPDGSQRTLSVSMHARKTSQGDVESIEGIAEDVTTRMQAQDALRESEKRFRTLFEESVVAIGMSSTPRGGIDHANRQLCQYLGYSAEDLRGKPVIRFIAPEDVPQTLAEIQDLFSREIPGITNEKRFIRKDGSIVWGQIGLSIVKNEQGIPLQSFVMIQDITDRKLAEHALKEAHRRLNILSSITRHDILNQIAALSMYIELLRETPVPPETAAIIQKTEIITGNIQKQITFTRDYQDIGVKAPLWHPVRPIITEAAEMLPLGEVALEIDVGDLEIFADPLLPKVFYTLIDNALRHAGKITKIRCSFDQSATGITVTFRDDGVGIPGEAKQGIFRREYYKHTGFGLYLTREILALTGMTIDETGEPGQGACFGIHVPAGAFRFGNTSPVP